MWVEFVLLLLFAVPHTVSGGKVFNLNRSNPNQPFTILLVGFLQWESYRVKANMENSRTKWVLTLSPHQVLALNGTKKVLQPKPEIKNQKHKSQTLNPKP